ncbi:MAG: hypothetical protein ACMUHB_06475 [Thermoplasmatota archaeon]
MKSTFNMSIDGTEVEVSVKGKKVTFDGEVKDVASASLSKKRKGPTFQLIVYLLLVLLLGIVVYASLSFIMPGDDGGDPYKELDELSEVPFNVGPSGVNTPLFLTGQSGYFMNLENEIAYNDDGARDRITFQEDVEGQVVLHLMWFGSADDLMTRGISQFRFKISTNDEFFISGVSMVRLGDDKRISEEVELPLPHPFSMGTFSGPKTMDMKVSSEVLGNIRNVQSASSNSNRGTYVTVTFTSGISKGDLLISAEWGPEYYHDTSYSQVISGVIGLIFVVVGFMVVFAKVGREEPCLILGNKDGEMVLFGDQDDLSKLHYQVSKLTIPKMKAEKRRSSRRAGVTQGEDLLDEDEAREIGSELKKRPGRKGRMIVHQCPDCLGTELYYETGFLAGYKYHCKKCDYVGSFVIEKEVRFDDS